MEALQSDVLAHVARTMEDARSVVMLACASKKIYAMLMTPDVWRHVSLVSTSAYAFPPTRFPRTLIKTLVKLETQTVRFPLLTVPLLDDLDALVNSSKFEKLMCDEVRFNYPVCRGTKIDLGIIDTDYLSFYAAINTNMDDDDDENGEVFLNEIASFYRFVDTVWRLTKRTGEVIVGLNLHVAAPRADLPLDLAALGDSAREISEHVCDDVRHESVSFNVHMLVASTTATLFSCTGTKRPGNVRTLRFRTGFTRGQS